MSNSKLVAKRRNTLLLAKEMITDPKLYRNVLNIAFTSRRLLYVTDRRFSLALQRILTIISLL